MRVKGRGAAAAGGAGDLLVTVDVIVPKELSDAQRVAIEALQAAESDLNPRVHLRL